MNYQWFEQQEAAYQQLQQQMQDPSFFQWENAQESL